VRYRQFSLIFIPFIYLNVYAQASTDSVSAVFNQVLETRSLRIISIINPISGPWKLHSSSYGEVVLRELPGYKSQWKRELGIKVEAERQLNKTVGLLLDIQNQTFRDQEAARIVDRGVTDVQPFRFDPLDLSSPVVTGQNSQIQRSAFRGGLRLRKPERFETHLLGGSAWDSQIEGSGNGPSGRFGLTFSGLDLHLPNIQSEASLNQFGDRQNHSARLNTSYNWVTNDSRDAFNAQWQNNRTDLFLGAQGNIVSRIQDQLLFNNKLTTVSSSGLVSSYDLTFRKAAVSYIGGGPGESNELDFNNRFSLGFDWRDLSSELYYAYMIEDRDYGESLILGRLQTLGTKLIKSFEEDSLIFHYNTRKLRYDSPEDVELSDRDRLIHQISITGLKWITEEAKASIALSLMSDHLVYISSDRSADNRYNRFLILRPGVEWIPEPGWRNQVLFIVMANYTSFDFDDPTTRSSLRSKAIRRWSVADTLSFPVWRDIGGDVSVRYDQEDRGRLLWEEFTQDVSDEWTSSFFSVSMHKFFWRQLKVRLGYHFEHRIENKFNRGIDGETVIERVRNYIVGGPVFQVMTRDTRRFRWYVNGNLFKVEDSRKDKSYRLDTISAAVTYLW